MYMQMRLMRLAGGKGRWMELVVGLLWSLVIISSREVDRGRVGKRSRDGEGGGKKRFRMKRRRRKGRRKRR